MVHLLGAGLLGLAAAIPGCMQARKTILEYRILQQLSEAVQIMHSELSCNLVTVQELFTQAAACGNRWTCSFTQRPCSWQRIPIVPPKRPCKLHWSSRPD